MGSLAEEFPKEQERCRLLSSEYARLPDNAGFLGAGLINGTLKQAELAMASGDPIRMLRAFEEMKKCK